MNVNMLSMLVPYQLLDLFDVRTLSVLVSNRYEAYRCSGIDFQGLMFRDCCSGIDLKGLMFRDRCSGIDLQGFMFKDRFSGIVVQGLMFRDRCSGLIFMDRCSVIDV